jgi:mRNA interferase RelE/StbE
LISSRPSTSHSRWRHGIWPPPAAIFCQPTKIKLEVFAATGQGDVKKLKGQTGARLRVGDWRVIYYEEAETIVVVAVGDRRDIYD